MASRFLPESEIHARRNELRAAIRSYRRQLHDAQVELTLIERWSTKLVEVDVPRNTDVRLRPPQAADTASARPSGPTADADEDEDSGSPTEAIMRIVADRRGLTRDEIYDLVESQFVSKSTNKRNVVLSTLRRLVTKYKRLDEVDGRYYLKGAAPSAAKSALPAFITATGGSRSYDKFQAPPFEDDDYVDFRAPPFLDDDDDGPDPDLSVE